MKAKTDSTGKSRVTDSNLVTQLPQNSLVTPVYGIKVHKITRDRSESYWAVDGTGTVLNTLFESVAIAQCEHLNRFYGSTETKYRVERIQ